MAIKGLEFVGNINWANIFGNISTFLSIVFVIGIIGGIIIWFSNRRKYNKAFDTNIQIFEDINGEWVNNGFDTARTLTVPRSNIKLLYLRKNDIYLPLPTRKIGKKTLWYGILKSGEWINYKQKSLNVQTQEMELDFDTSDSKLLYVNQQKVLQEHYKDKATKWWKEYKEIISTVLLIFVWTISIFILFGRIEMVLDKAGVFVEQLSANSELIKEAMEILKEIRAGSGVIQVG